MKITSAAEAARLCDHALLYPNLTDAQLEAQTKEMHPYAPASICIKPYAVADCVKWLEGTPIATCTVIGFPSGSPLPEVKALEARRAFEAGATEMDMVVNVGKVLSADWSYVREDIDAVLQVTRQHRGIVKVIFETDFLPSDESKIELCKICGDLGVDFVKTSTGFGYKKSADGTIGYDGATDHDIKLMREHTPASVGIKPSGAVRSFERVMQLVELGATRIGTSSTVAIYREAKQHFGEAASATDSTGATGDGY